MKKLVVLSGGLVAVGSAALVGAGIAMSQPGGSSMNVVGEPYNKALAILKGPGFKGYFGGSFGSVLSQSQLPGRHAEGHFGGPNPADAGLHPARRRHARGDGPGCRPAGRQ